MLNLTPTQLSAVKAWIVANHNSVFDGTAVVALNATASPTYKVWRKSLNKHDLIELPDVDSTDAVTTFAGGGGTGSYIDRSQGERDGWRELWNSTLLCKPYLANVRVMLFDIFSGAAALAQQNRRHFWARGQRPARVWEKLLATATSGGPRHDAANGNNPAGQTGTRGAWTNPDTLGVDSGGLLLDGPIDLDTVIASAGAA